VQRSCAVTATDTLERCPECGSTELYRARKAPPWCVQCEWNLGEWPEPKRRRGRRGALRDRRRAFQTNRRLLAALEGTEPGPPRRTRTATVLIAASVLLVVADVALFAGGIVLLFSGSFLLILAAVFMILIAIECRLRFAKIDRVGEVSRTEAPNLWKAVDQACAAVAAPEIDVLVVTNEFNASCGRDGLRGRTVLKLGLPLWGALSPAGRFALLGHELGHLVNGDPARGMATSPALTTFGRLAQIIDPHDLVDTGNAVGRQVGTAAAYVVLLPLHLLFGWIAFALIRIATPDHQRAEVYADVLAVRLGGTAGAEHLMYVTLFEKPVEMALKRGVAGSADPDDWRVAVAKTVDGCMEHLRISEQASMRRDASPYLDHPPTGVRSRLVRSWPAVPPAVPVPAETLAAADGELTRQYRSAARAIANGWI